MNAEFLDSNVLVYAYGDEPRRQKLASVLVDRLSSQKSGAISTQTLIEFYAVSTRKLKLPPRVAQSVLEDFRYWPIHVASIDEIGKASRLQEKYQLSFWDAMIVNSAIEMDCSVLWTEDLNDGQKFGNLVVRNPFP